MRIEICRDTPSPTVREGGFVDVEFRLTQTAGRNSPAWVGDFLYASLRSDEGINQTPEGRRGILAQSVSI